MAKQEEMTLEKLAQMTQRGFLSVDKRIDGIEERMATKSDLEKFATKSDLRETEERLLDAIRGIEVKKRDFEALQSEVGELSRRVGAPEKKI